MQYLQLRNELKDFTVFSIDDIRKLDVNFHRRRLTEWQNKGYIKKIVKGYYVFSDLKINENILFLIANNIYTPSYISLEMALSYYNLIPESVYEVTSISTKKTYRFKTSLSEFSYRSIKPDFFFGYKLMKYNNKCFKIASIEKTILDYLYINPHIKTADDFSSLRINEENFLDQINKKKLDRMLIVFNKKVLTQRVEKFWEFIKNA